MFSKLTKILLTLIIACTVTWAQSDKDKVIVAKFGDQNISLKEFETAYAKNAGGIDKAKKDSMNSYANFLDLYLKYKMKLAEAEEKGLDKDPSILEELNDYKEKIATGYLIDKKIIEPETKKLYERRKWEYRVSHIMFIPQKGKEDSTYKMAEKVLKSIKDGIDFATLARRYSQDKNSGYYGGDIYYITAGYLPADFEDAVYSTKVGDVYPKIVQTQYGYHIVKVTDKEPRVPEIRASHILCSYSVNGKADTAKAYETIKMVLDSLKAGGDFSELAKKYSNDPGSAQKGGDLGFFARRRMVKPFDEAAFNLKKVGDISGIVQTRYGFHIIKLTGRLSMPTYDQDKAELTKLFKQNRYKDALLKLTSELKAKYGFNLNTTNFVKLVKAADTLKVGQTNNELNKLRDLTIFSFKNKKYSIGEIIDIIYSSKDNVDQKLTPNYLSSAVDRISNDKALAMETSRLEDINPQFASLMNDYKKGILVFRIQQNEVWNKIKIDSVKLKEYFEQNRKNYTWPDRVDFSEIFTRSDSLIKHYVQLLKQGENFDTLASKYTERKGFAEKAGRWGLKNANQNDLTEKAFTLTKPGEISDIYKNFGGYSVIKLIEKDPAREKTFEEAKNEVTAAYQEKQAHLLENEYVNKLEKKYKPIIFKEKLSEAFK